MSGFRRLGVRLFLSYLVVILVSSGVVYVTARALAPTFFEVELRQGRTDADRPGSTLGPGGPGGSGTTRAGGRDGASGSGGTGAGPDASAGGVFASETIVVVDEDVATAFRESVDDSLLLALAVSLVVAGGFAAVLSRRILDPVTRVQDTARALAGGRYGERVPIPRDQDLAGLARDINTLAASLEQTELRRSQLISDVAHELRTPLTTIQGSMEALLDGVMEPTDAVFSSVADEASRLQRVVADLGLLSRLEEAALPMELGPVDAGSIAATVAERLRPQFVEKGVLLHVDVPETLETVGDPDRLAQVFTNLIGNALTHTPTGGTVHVGGDNTGNTVTVHIADTGEGIAEEHLERVFERFFRLGGSDRGSGIGLTIARSIARAHGGEIVARSGGPGLGSTFEVVLPR